MQVEQQLIHGKQYFINQGFGVLKAVNSPEEVARALPPARTLARREEMKAVNHRQSYKEVTHPDLLALAETEAARGAFEALLGDYEPVENLELVAEWRQNSLSAAEVDSQIRGYCHVDGKDPAYGRPYPTFCFAWGVVLSRIASDRALYGSPVMYPGTHHWLVEELARTGRTMQDPYFHERWKSMRDASSYQSLDLFPGDVILFHSALSHSTAPNIVGEDPRLIAWFRIRHPQHKCDAPSRTPFECFQGSLFE